MYTVIPDMSAVMQNSGFRHCVSQSFFYSWLCVPLMSGDIPNTVISGCYYSAFDERNQKKKSALPDIKFHIQNSGALLLALLFKPPKKGKSFSFHG